MSDNHGARYLGRIKKLPQKHPKRGESIQGYFVSLEDERKSLKQIQLPEMDLSELGFSVNPENGIPTILDSSKLMIQMAVDRAYVEVPKVNEGSRV